MIFFKKSNLNEIKKEKIKLEEQKSAIQNIETLTMYETKLPNYLMSFLQF